MQSEFPAPSDRVTSTVYRAARRPRRGRLLLVAALLLAALVVVAVLVWRQSQNGPLTVPAPYAAVVDRAATTCPAVTVPLLAAQLHAESGWNPSADSGQAQGIAQFTPATWAEWGRDYDGSGKASVWEPGDAIPAQARYLCALFKQVAHVPGDPTANALAAYNAGPGAVVKAGGVPDFAQTRAYVKRIESDLEPRYARGLNGATAAPTT